jgi:hypothetical protein
LWLDARTRGDAGAFRKHGRRCDPANPTHRRADHENVVQLSDDGDECRNQLDGAEHVGGGARSDQSRGPGRLRMPEHPRNHSCFVCQRPNARFPVQRIPPRARARISQFSAGIVETFRPGVNLMLFRFGSFTFCNRRNSALTIDVDVQGEAERVDIANRRVFYDLTRIVGLHSQV